MKLSQMKCIPCRKGAPKMKPAEIRKSLKEAKGWVHIKERFDKIYREYTFKDFAQLMKFVNKVARLAEKEGHHPDICIYRWNHLRLELYTHKINGLHQNDFILAAKINKLK
jgi:4a-hydroxytetrahydrobiopterin dehydratase